MANMVISVVHMSTYGERLEAAIALQIKVELVERAMDQKALAEAVDIEPATLSRYMKGRRSMPMPIFFKVSDALGISAAELMERAEARITEAD